MTEPMAPEPAMSKGTRISRLPRWTHQLYAWVLRYFWTPCYLCGRSFGGHELREIDGKSCSINLVEFVERSNIYVTTTQGVGICPSCTREGLGDES